MGNYETVKGNIYKFSPTESGELSVFDSDKIIKFYHKDEDCVFIGTGETVVIDYELEDITSDEDTLRKNCINNIHWQNKNRYKDCLTEANLIDVANNSIAKNYNEDLTIDGQWVYPLNSSYNDDLDFSNARFNKGSLELINNSLSTNSDANKTVKLGINHDLCCDSDVQSVIKNIEQKNWTVEKTYNNHLLPKGYTRIDFLESTGYQTLSFDWTTDIFYTVDIACMKHSTIDYDMGKQDITYRTRYAARSSGWNLYASGKVGDAELAEIGKRVTVYHELNYSSQASALGVNDRIWRLNLMGTHQPPQKYYMFSEVRNTGIGHYRIFQAHITDKQNKEMSFVPAISPDGEPCMYDKITKQTLYNVGSGSFVAGIKSLSQLATLSENLPDATSDTSTIHLSLPSSLLLDYDELEKVMDRFADKGWIIEIKSWYEDEQISGNVMPVSFLESTGSQWIDIEEPLNHTCVIECVSQRISAGGIYGARLENGSQEFILWAGCSTVRWGSYWPSYNLNYNASPVILDIIHTKHYNKFELNGEIVARAAKPQETWENEINCYLFAVNLADEATHISQSRIWAFKLEKEGQVCRNLIPVIAEGVPCMYDKITKQSFYNSNEDSNSFIIGVDTKIQLRAIVQSLPDNTDNYIENEDGTQTPVVKTLVISIPADWLGEGDIDSWLSGDFGQEIQQYATDINWTLQFNTH